MEPAPEDAIPLDLSAGQFVHLLKAAQQLQLPENEQFLLSMLLEELELMVQQ